MHPFPMTDAKELISRWSCLFGVSNTMNQLAFSPRFQAGASRIHLIISQIQYLDTDVEKLRLPFVLNNSLLSQSGVDQSM